jgi:hypothetical protein
MINEGVVSGADIVRFERLASACLEVSAKLFCGEGNLDPSWHDKVTSQAIVMFRAMRDEIEILP